MLRKITKISRAIHAVIYRGKNITSVDILKCCNAPCAPNASCEHLYSTTESTDHTAVWCAIKFKVYQGILKLSANHADGNIAAVYLHRNVLFVSDELH